VFAAVAGTVGGSAAVAANSAEGQMKRLSLTIGETKESIGAAFLPILERLLPVLQRFAQYVQNNTDKVLAVMAVVGSLAGAILALNAVMKVITVTQLALNLAMAANPIGLVVTAVALLVAGFGVLVAKTGSVKNAFASMGNFVIGIFENIGNTFVAMINTVIDGLNAVNPIGEIDRVGEFKLPRFNVGQGGGGGGVIAAGPDRVERMIQVPSIPAIAPVTLPAPSGGGGGGSRGGGGGGEIMVQPFDPSVYDPKSRYYEVPAMLDAAYAPKQNVYNITVNAAVAEASLGQTIVDALTDYTRVSGPLELQIAV
jgi:hypothetical protein